MAGKKRGPKGSRKDREKRITLMSDRYMQGASLLELSDEFGVTVSQASYDIADVRKDMRANRQAALAERADREAAVLDKLEAECWDSLERSKEEGKAGDSGWATQIGSCIERRCKIYGLFAPDRMQINQAGPSFLGIANLASEIQLRLAALRPNVIETNGHSTNGKSGGLVSSDDGGMDAGPATNGNGHRPDTGQAAE